jgi:hypothetical protein
VRYGGVVVRWCRRLRRRALYVSVMSVPLVVNVCPPGNATSAGRLSVTARPLGFDSTDHPPADLAAHTRRPKSPIHRPSFSPAPPRPTRRPGVHSCAVCLAAALLSARVLPPENDYPDSLHPAPASHTMSCVKLVPVSTVHPALATDSLHACPPTPSKLPAASSSCPRTPHVSYLFAARAPRASAGRLAQLWSQH